MDTITSRKNVYIQHLRRLSTDASYRDSEREYVCEGMKPLREALEYGADVRSVLWKETPEALSGLENVRQYIAPAELFDYASTMTNSPGPIFTVSMPEFDRKAISGAVVLENVQDPGNVGTVIRTANAFGIDAVILTGACADLYNPKAVRSTMGAVFRQRVLKTDIDGLRKILEENGLKLYGAALSDSASDIRQAKLTNAAAAIGSEGKGLSAELLEMCDEQIIIPMDPCSESLNAAVAASLVMWEMVR